GALCRQRQERSGLPPGSRRGTSRRPAGDHRRPEAGRAGDRHRPATGAAGHHGRAETRGDARRGSNGGRKAEHGRDQVVANHSTKGEAMSQRLKGKVTIVTGASKGIGAAIATEFAKEGATVVVNYSSSKEGADRVVGEITRRGGWAASMQAD